MEEEAQNEFHLGQVVVSRMRESTFMGAVLGRCVLARTAKWPPGPWVGTGMGATIPAVTRLEAERGVVVGAYGILRL
jgi:hypothetical protein